MSLALSNICVGSQTDYANSRLVFDWFSLDDLDDAKEYASKFDEAYLADIEGPIAAIKQYLGDHLMWDVIEKVGALLEKHGDLLVALLSVKSLDDIDLDDIEENGINASSYKDAEDYGWELAGDEIPNHLNYYFDFKAYGKAVLDEESHTTHEGLLYVFHGSQ
jgi:hypothetical protein